jgi:NADH:ubiquinone oxidoreductase subunit 2 (subunit N)
VHLRGRTGRGDYVGLGATQPLAALALAFLSLVGIPLLAGFLLQKQ